MRLYLLKKLLFFVQLAIGLSFLTTARQISPSSIFIISASVKPKRYCFLKESHIVGSSSMSKSTSSYRSSIFGLVGSSAKTFVSVTAGFIVLFSKSWIPLYYILGAVANAIFSKIIKKVLRHPRPPTSKKGGYGMPSSHAQSLFYFFTVITSIGSYKADHRFFSLHVLVSLATGVYATVASFWRVSSGLHTTAQTIVGAALGSIVGFYTFTNEKSVCSVLSTVFAPKVPILVKAPVLTIGALVLYSKEIKKRLHRN